VAANYNGELERRTAILRRFRELLVDQRNKFEKYLNVLDHEKGDIESGDVDKLVAHVELEESIVSEIYTFQKVIDPLEDLYRAAYPPGSEGAPQSHDIPAIKGALVELRTEVLKRNEENRTLLKRRMEILRGEMMSLRGPLSVKRSVYAEQGSGSILDIKG